MPSIIQTDSVDVSAVYHGSLLFLPQSNLSRDLCDFATKVVEEVFGLRIGEIGTDESTDVHTFIAKAKKCKNTFTSGKQTKKLLAALISERYNLYKNENLLFDVPRLRIVPKSSFLSSGISYNYKPHRDTWYGGGEDQINHWMSLANVTENSTFYIAPSFFSRKIDNNSETFDLDEWYSKYSLNAEFSVEREERPHPVPLVDVSMDDVNKIVIPPGSEIVFSGHHLHGSSQSTNSLVRFSIDYRVYFEKSMHQVPKNIDSRASGDYKKYLFPLLIENNLIRDQK